MTALSPEGCLAALTLGYGWKKLWVPHRTYQVDDVVIWQGALYVCIQSHENIKPCDTSCWDLVPESDQVVLGGASLGSQGPPGPQGPTGPSGTGGADGPQGLQGDPGVKGDTGPQGPTGDTGATGSQGVKGDTGNTGPQGIQGIQGPAGADGAQGAKGDKGDTGNPGAQGTQGIQGIQGVQGPPGDVSAAWPIGSIFISVVSTNPATLLGFGTWSAFGAGRVLVGLDAGDANFDVVEETGGAKTSAISAHSGTAVDDHASHTHSVTSNVTQNVFTNPTIAWPASVPTHSGTTATFSGNSNTTAAANTGATGSGATTSTLTLKAHTHTVTPTGTVTITSQGTIAWPAGVPTASGGAVSLTNNAVTSGGPSATLTHAVTQPSAHSDVSVVQPYIVVYMWKRTA